MKIKAILVEMPDRYRTVGLSYNYFLVSVDGEQKLYCVPVDAPEDVDDMFNIQGADTRQDIRDWGICEDDLQEIFDRDLLFLLDPKFAPLTDAQWEEMLKSYSFIDSNPARVVDYEVRADLPNGQQLCIVGYDDETCEYEVHLGSSAFFLKTKNQISEVESIENVYSRSTFEDRATLEKYPNLACIACRVFQDDIVGFPAPPSMEMITAEEARIAARPKLVPEVA
ncbi:hypothetical protein [Dyella telluris]|uniref:Uncharacterized protein n=1 Tax=Dyella telluris TaxID=2763498 RepID=A0A7G8Q4J9_9GAMM|nr:hypothetical protein [Dyella telluris]QNK01707.1 hypothetical protein H8F01_00560 [Dyella telluris]